MELAETSGPLNLNRVDFVVAFCRTLPVRRLEARSPGSQLLTLAMTQRLQSRFILVCSITGLESRCIFDRQRRRR